MMGDYHVRFCERGRVKLPFPTRHDTLAPVRNTEWELDYISRKTIQIEVKFFRNNDIL